MPAAGPATGIPAPVMLLAHLAAVALGAILVEACERLYAALSSAIRGYGRVARPESTARPSLVRDGPTIHSGASCSLPHRYAPRSPGRRRTLTVHLNSPAIQGSSNMSLDRLISRALITTAAAGTLAFGAVVGSAPASAHVHVDADADEAVQGDSAILTFRVPNESDAGSPTTALSVALPNLTSVSTAVMPGWTARLDRDDAAGTVRSVTWSAAPNSWIGADQSACSRFASSSPIAPLSASCHPDVRRRHSRALGPAASARRRRTRTSSAHADADRRHR